MSAWAKCVGAVVKALSDFDPAHAATYQDQCGGLPRTAQGAARVRAKSIRSIPEKSRVLITSHDAFNYFGRAYGIEVQGVQGISTESEAGLQRINELVDMIVEKRVQAVFVESSVPRKNIEALRKGLAARGHVAEIGGELFSDAMGDDRNL